MVGEGRKGEEWLERESGLPKRKSYTRSYVVAKMNQGHLRGSLVLFTGSVSNEKRR